MCPQSDHTYVFEKPAIDDAPIPQKSSSDTVSAKASRKTAHNCVEGVGQVTIVPTSVGKDGTVWMINSSGCAADDEKSNTVKCVSGRGPILKYTPVTKVGSSTSEPELNKQHMTVVGNAAIGASHGSSTGKITMLKVIKNNGRCHIEEIKCNDPSNEESRVSGFRPPQIISMGNPRPLTYAAEDVPSVSIKPGALHQVLNYHKAGISKMKTGAHHSETINAVKPRRDQPNIVTVGLTPEQIAHRKVTAGPSRSITVSHTEDGAKSLATPPGRFQIVKVSKPAGIPGIPSHMLSEFQLKPSSDKPVAVGTNYVHGVGRVMDNPLNMLIYMHNLQTTLPYSKSDSEQGLRQIIPKCGILSDCGAPINPAHEALFEELRRERYKPNPRIAVSSAPKLPNVEESVGSSAPKLPNCKYTSDVMTYSNVQPIQTRIVQPVNDITKAVPPAPNNSKPKKMTIDTSNLSDQLVNEVVPLNTNNSFKEPRKTSVDSSCFCDRLVNKITDTTCGGLPLLDGTTEGEGVATVTIPNSFMIQNDMQRIFDMAAFTPIDGPLPTETVAEGHTSKHDTDKDNLRTETTDDSVVPGIVEDIKSGFKTVVEEITNEPKTVAHGNAKSSASLPSVHFGSKLFYSGSSEKIPRSRRTIQIDQTMKSTCKKWDAYLHMSETNMHGFELQNAMAFNYTEDATTMITERDLYVWQLLENMTPSDIYTSVWSPWN